MAATEMARAETIEHVGETGGGGNSPLPRQGTCHMELPGPFNTWFTTTTPITTGSGTGTGSLNHLHHNQPPQQQAFLLPCPASSLHLEGQDGPRTQQRTSPLSPSSSTPPPPSPPCNRREGRRRGTAQPSAFSGEQSDLDREEHREASRRQGPLPDLLPQNEHHSWASQQQQHHHGATGGEAEPELEVRRLADQLRVIGDEFNTTVLRRAHAGPHWQDIWRGLLNFIDHTLSTLYRLT